MVLLSRRCNKSRYIMAAGSDMLEKRTFPHDTQGVVGEPPVKIRGDAEMKRNNWKTSCIPLERNM
jgi:hypothetical protein